MSTNQKIELLKKHEQQFLSFVSKWNLKFFINWRVEKCFELKKIAVARIFMSLFCSHKALSDFNDHIVINNIHRLNEFETSTWLMVSLFAVSILSCIGLFTTFSVFLMMILFFLSDQALEIHSLGSAAFANSILILVLVPSGRYYSLDNFFKCQLTTVFKPELRCSESFIKQSYGLAILVFASTNFISVLGHLMNSHWQDLTAIEKTLLNPFYSVHFKSFAKIHQYAHPYFSQILSLATFLQMFWQLFMLPLLFNTYGRYFVIIWGAIFLVLSELLLHLGHLDKWLLCMWIIVFFAPPLSKRSEQNLPYKQSDTASSWWQLTPTLVATPFFVSFVLAALLTFKTVLVSYHENIAPSSNLTFALKSKLSNTTLFMFDLASFIGLTAPNVFNKEDVDAANLFAFIEKKNIKNGKWSLVPFIGYDGSRLALHGSDIFRYRISIPVRRCLQVSSFPECKHLLHPVLNIYNKIENKNRYLYRIVVIDKLKNHIEKYSM